VLARVAALAFWARNNAPIAALTRFGECRGAVKTAEFQ
jgi:hypothetical protein